MGCLSVLTALAGGVGAEAAGLTLFASTKDDLGAVLSILKSFWDMIAQIVGFFTEKTTEAGMEPDLVIVLFLVFVLTLWLASGCWAASIAGARRHSVKLSFAIGLAVPLFYPLVILFAMDIKGAKDREERAQQEALEEAEQARIREQVAAKAAEEAELTGEASALPAIEEEEQVYDFDFFKRIAYDEDGNVTGPWLIRYGSNEIIAPTVADILPHAVVVEIPQGSEGKLQRIRIPYGMITACELMR